MLVLNSAVTREQLSRFLYAVSLFINTEVPSYTPGCHKTPLNIQRRLVLMLDCE